MSTTLFTNVRIIDGGGDAPFTGEVLVDGERIAAVSRQAGQLGGDHRTIDGAGQTLMPGLCDAHTHFSWVNQTSLDTIGLMPVEEHILEAANNAKTYLDYGYTSCVGAAAAKPRLDVVIRNAINSGGFPARATWPTARRSPPSAAWATSIPATWPPTPMSR